MQREICDMKVYLRFWFPKYILSFQSSTAELLLGNFNNLNMSENLYKVYKLAVEMRILILS